MNWTRISSEPITTESEVSVISEAGVVGCVGVRWTDNRPQFFGAVTKREFAYDSFGTRVGEGSVTVLDPDPTMR